MVRNSTFRVSSVPPEYIAGEVYKRITRLVLEARAPTFEFRQNHLKGTVQVFLLLQLHPTGTVAPNFEVNPDEPTTEAILRGTREVSQFLIRGGHCANRTRRN